MALAFEFVALALAVFALYRSRKAGGYYDADVYGMTPRTHRSYALLAGISILLLVMRRFVPVPFYEFTVEAAIAILAVFYFASFLRGAHEES